MARRSSRLVSGGYYNSDEESDSSSVTNISYRENPVKVFKKKAGTRKGAKGKTTASTGSPEQSITAGQYEDLSPSPSVSGSQTTMGTTPYSSSTVPTPRPALTPTRCSSTPAERSPLAGPRLHKELSQSGVDSSGYSSSEGPLRKPVATSSPIRTSDTTGAAPSPGYRISRTIYSVIDSISVAATAVKSEVMRQATLANTSLGGHTKKACGLLLLLLLLLLCVWFLLPWVASLISRPTVAKTPSQSPPVVAPPPQLNTMHPPPVVDSVLVSAVVEAKLQRVTEELQTKLRELQMKQQELQLKQEHIVSQMNERLQQDVQDMKAKLEVVDSNGRQRLQQELAGLSRQLLDLRTDSSSTVDSLRLSIQSVEAQNAKLSEEWSTFQAMPPPAPCPDQSSSPVLTELTPEMQQAMERWFTDHIKEQDAVRLTEGGGCSECVRPVADKMPDFALETQGASVISTRCSETYRIRSACVTVFGIPLWYPSESPRTVIQGFPVLLPGKCWAFHGVQGTLVISLSHPITISHVTLDHLPRHNSPTGRIDSAPKNFEVYGMKDDIEEGTLLGTFTYNEQGESSQTFKLPSPSEVVYRVVELRVLSNWGHVEYTCLYRFRVHGQMAST